MALERLFYTFVGMCISGWASESGRAVSSVCHNSV